MTDASRGIGSAQAALPNLAARCDDFRRAGGRAVFVWTVAGRRAETSTAVEIAGCEELELDRAGGVAATFGWLDADVLIHALALALLTAFYVLPILFLTVRPATLPSPGRIDLVSMSDVSLGVAAFAGELFGLREGFGAVLIVSPGLVEVLGRDGG